MLKGEQADGSQAQRSLLSYGHDQTEPNPRLPAGSLPQERHYSVRDRRDARRRSRTPEQPREADASAEAVTTKGAWETFAEARVGEEPFHIVRERADDQGAPARTQRTRQADPTSEPGAATRVVSPLAGETTPVADAPVVHAVDDEPVAVAYRPVDHGAAQPKHNSANGVLLRSKRLILATTILGAVVGVGIALAMPKKYEATAELLTEPRDFAFAENDRTAEGLASDATLAIENQIAVLKSSTVLTQVVDKLNLSADTEFNGQKGSFNAGAFMTELRALLTRSGGEADDAAAGKNTRAVETLARSLTIEPSSKAFAINIGVSTESADKSALIANTVASTFLELYGPLQAQSAGDRSARLDDLRKGVEAAERQVAIFKTENDIVDPQGGPVTDDEMVRLNEQLATARARTLELNAHAAAVRDIDVDSVLGGAIPDSLTTGAVAELMTHYAAIRQEADKLTVRLGPRHPERQAAEAQVSGMRAKIGSELRRIASSVQVDLKQAVALEQQLAQRLAQLKVRPGDAGNERARLLDLEREVATKRAAYEAYRQQMAGTGIDTASATVISPADAPLHAAGPSRSLIALAGLFLGFASGVGLAAMRGASDAPHGRRRGEGRPAAPADRDGPAPVAPLSAATQDIQPARERGNRQPPPLDEPSHARSAIKPEHPSTPDVATEDKSMHHRYADRHPAWNTAQPGNEPGQGWAPPHQPLPAGYAPYPAGHPMQGAYIHPMPAYYPAPQPTYPYPMPVPFHGYDHRGYAQPPMPQPYPPYGMAVPVYPAYPPSHPLPEMHHVPVAGYRDAPNVITYPERYVRAVDAAPPVSATLAEERVASSRAIEEIRASLAEFREAVRDLTESRQKRRFF